MMPLLLEVSWRLLIITTILTSNKLPTKMDLQGTPVNGVKGESVGHWL